MAEIGLDRGEYAQMFLSRWQGDQYWAIDNYAPYPEWDFPRDADRIIALHRLAHHGKRFKLIPEDSISATRHFKDGSIDFIYIDGAHDYESVKADLAAWFPKVSNHGILAGHDFDPNHPGVMQAVTEFGREIRQTVYLTAVDGYQREECPSWYLYKNGMPGPEWRRC